MTASLKLVKKKIENIKKVGKEEKDKKIKEDSDDEGDISDEDDRKELDDADKIENECGNIIKLIKGIIAFSNKEKIFSHIFEKYFLD